MSRHADMPDLRYITYPAHGRWRAHTSGANWSLDGASSAASSASRSVASSPVGPMTRVTCAVTLMVRR